MSKPLWENFEIAVAKFCAALDPNATVSHNVSIPDLDTGTPRQRDVWIEARLCKQFPVKALVSCKRYKRKITQQDMDAFLGELRSSGANVGVLYSFSGFTNNAIAKAKVAGVSCCRLYSNEPPDLPEIICLSSYCWRPRIQLTLPVLPSPDWNSTKWQDIFILQNGTTTVLDELVEAFNRCHEAAIEETTKGKFSPDRLVSLGVLVEERDGLTSFIINVVHHWRVFRANVAAHLVNGSYSETLKEFVGSFHTPAIDTWESHPGNGWDELPTGAGEILEPAMHVISKFPDAKSALSLGLGDKPFE